MGDFGWPPGHLGHIGIVETGADDRRLQIVVADDQRYTAQVAKRAFMQAQEGLDALIPDALFVAVPRVAEGQAKDSRAVPFAGRGIERWGAAEEVHLAFRARRTSERRRSRGAATTAACG